MVRTNHNRLLGACARSIPSDYIGEDPMKTCLSRAKDVSISAQNSKVGRTVRKEYNEASLFNVGPSTIRRGLITLTHACVH